MGPLHDAVLNETELSTIDDVEAHENVDEALAGPAPDGVWISRFTAAELHARADAIDPGLPLAGVTFAVKDNIDVAGLPTTAGCPDFAYLPERNAPVVQRLIDAGAIVIGKTNLDQFATGLTGARSPYGVPESVFGGGLISGGQRVGGVLPRHRHGGVRAGAGGTQRHRRDQTDPGAAQHARGGAGLPVAGLRLGLRPGTAPGRVGDAHRAWP
jgi:hypothetical protein